MYGRKKEDTPSVDGQTNLFVTDSFSEPEQTGQESQELIEVKSFRWKKTKGKKPCRWHTYPQIIFTIIWRVKTVFVMLMALV
ncbi:hypothetical protein [Enterococcus sp. DIV0756]|uniref:hypothetical protein n=1 Tax=Enterococcus sp. DIV0756 TaxID=2774636 RepID=UPI003F686295